MTDIELRDQGYRDGEAGLEPQLLNCVPYIDGYRLGHMVYLADRAKGLSREQPY